jgi:gamma-tubulin complex component 2
VHTLSLLYQLTTELATADGSGKVGRPSSSSRAGSRAGSGSDEDDEDDDDDDDDPEQQAKNEALGLGGAYKAAVARIKGSSKDTGSGGGGLVKGGEVLAILHERRERTAGDPAARQLYSALLARAGIPYVRAVRAWVGRGRLEDAYGELLVREDGNIGRGILDVDYTDEYWEKRYTVGIQCDVESESFAKGSFCLFFPPESSSYWERVC